MTYRLTSLAIRALLKHRMCFTVRAYAFLYLCGGVSLLCQAQIPIDVIRKAGVVFAGTVKEIGAASFPEVPRSPRTIVVRIDSVWKKPDAVSLRVGDYATVEVRDPSSFKSGTRAIFYTDGWIFGSGIAVKELDHSILTTAEAISPAGQQKFQQIRLEAEDRDLLDRLSSADSVVVGQVADVRRVTGVTRARDQAPVSEHDPEWEEGIIDVISQLKGPEVKRVVVRFAAARDIAWSQSPKLYVGQRGTFLLKKDQTTGFGEALLAEERVTAYAVLRPGDVLASSEALRVTSLLKK